MLARCFRRQDIRLDCTPSLIGRFSGADQGQWRDDAEDEVVSFVGRFRELNVVAKLEPSFFELTVAWLLTFSGRRK